MPQEDQVTPLSLDVPSTKTLEEAGPDIRGVTEVSGLALLFCDPLLALTSWKQPLQASPTRSHNPQTRPNADWPWHFLKT